MLLWQEYHEQYQEKAYAYTQFCEHFTRWCQRQFKIDPLIDVIAEVKLTHPRN